MRFFALLVFASVFGARGFAATTARAPRPFTLIPSAPSILTQADFQCRAWFRLFVREESGRVPPFNYLRNQYQALELFDAWYRGQSRKTYEETLNEMNRVGLTGSDGKSPYDAGTYHTSRIPPGYRYSESDRRFRVKPMEAVLTLIRELPTHKARSDPRLEARFLSLLYVYYNIAHGHSATLDKLFNQVNNSLYMAQINYLLEIHGYHGISHGKMDMGGNRRERFFSAIRAKNPDAVTPAELFPPRHSVLDYPDRLYIGVLALWIENPNLSADDVAAEIGRKLPPPVPFRDPPPTADDVRRAWKEIGISIE